MAIQQYYCTDTQLGYAISTVLADRIANPNADGTPEAAIRTFFRKRASYMMHSILGGSPRVVDAAAFHPETYVAGSYPAVETQCAVLSATLLKERVDKEAFVYDEDNVIQWCFDVRDGRIDL